MPEFTTVSIKEAQLRALPGRQGKYLGDYADYLLQLPQGGAGKLTIDVSEKHTTVRRRLTVAANTLGIHIIIKRSGNDLYFWRENGADEQPRGKRRYTRRKREHEETTPDQPFSAADEVDYEAALEQSPELGQTEQVVEDAMRRVDPE